MEFLGREMTFSLIEVQSEFPMLKMIKVDNLGDASKLYFTLHEVNSLHSENCKMGWKTGSFYKVKNKEQQRKTENI